MESNTLTIIDTSADGVEANGNSFLKAISRDGRFVEFVSLGTNLVVSGSNDQPVSNPVWRRYLKDRLTGELKALLPIPFPNILSPVHILSDEGRYLLGTAMYGEPFASSQVTVEDLTTGTSVIASSSPSNKPGGLSTYGGSISGDGRYFAFTSKSTDLLSKTTDHPIDMYVKDVITGELHRVSEFGQNLPGIKGMGIPALSKDGRFVSFGVGRIVENVNRSDVFVTASGFHRLGDLDGNGLVNTQDVVRMFRIFLNIEEATPEDIASGDVRPRPGNEGKPYGDGKLGSDDLNWLLRSIVGLEVVP